MTRCFAVLALTAAMTAAFSSQKRTPSISATRAASAWSSVASKVQHMIFRGKLGLTDRRVAESIAVNVPVSD